MKLDRVEIKNFRSIKEHTLSFDPACRVLVGINESGKSNILKALRLLNESYKPSKIDDVRERVGREKNINEAYVRFIFKMEKSDSDLVLSRVMGKILASGEEAKIVSVGTKKISIKDYCAERNEAIWRVNLLEETKGASYWNLINGYKILSGWKKPTNICPPEFEIEVKGQKVKLRSFKYIEVAELPPGIPAEYLENFSSSDLNTSVGTELMHVVENNLPETIFWEYDENDLLPNSVDIAKFSANPDSCPPLKNMFILAGIDEEDIKETLETELQGSPNQVQNFLDQIADQTTGHFRTVWEEYRDISFSLRLNANNIIPGVKEANTHDFAKRSDGFKRFVTFLLMISVEVETQQMEDTLLLIDEPEMSLHPSGARYLRNELIRISKKNYVVYSTHSIFMIDSGNIGRHYIVKKKGEVTTLEEADASNIAEEEVLLNALGYSAFEILKEKNIIFEGYKDKKLFQVALGAASAALKRKFERVGICHGTGASSLRAITPIIELAKRDCIIVSDGDDPALREQKNYKTNKGFGTWFTYQEIDPTVTAVTGEDFVKKALVVSSVNKVIAGGSMPAFTLADLPTDHRKLETIKDWLVANGMTVDQAKSTLVNIKDEIFENLTPANIETEYTKLLSGIVL